MGGTWILKQAGVPTPIEVASHPLLNSQIKFWGAIWLGYGVILWCAAGDVRARAETLRRLLATMFLVGLGRALSSALYGSPGPLFDGAMLLELTGVPAFWPWHRRMLRG